MRTRVLIFDDDPLIRQMLWAVCDRRDYEVFTFPDPGLCPLHTVERCPCGEDEICADIILSDLAMPNVPGLDFVESMIHKDCRCPRIALMSGSWSEDDIARARNLGCRLFAKPFHISQIVEWLDEVERLLSPNRRLYSWHSSRTVSEQ